MPERLRHAWTAVCGRSGRRDPGALFENCGGVPRKNFCLVLPYAELSAAARDAVVRNENALLFLETELVSRWEEEEADAGIRG